jgi:phosphatidylinositol glycan class F
MTNLFVTHQFNDYIEYILMRISINTIKGAWLGALVIPLDWDRWYQTFPTCCFLSSILGFIYGALTSKRVKNS